MRQGGRSVRNSSVGRSSLRRGSVLGSSVQRAPAGSRWCSRVRAAAAVSLAAALCACGDEGGADPVARGERAYRANCVVCHAIDPTRDGSVGPAVAGASRELVEARVLRAEYPAGYTPKRDTLLMPAQPFLAPEVPYLAAYLEAAAGGARDSSAAAGEAGAAQ